MKLSKLLKMLDMAKVVLYCRELEEPLYEGWADETPFWIANSHEIEDNEEILQEYDTRPISVRNNPHVLVILLKVKGEK